MGQIEGKKGVINERYNENKDGLHCIRYRFTT